MTPNPYWGKGIFEFYSLFFTRFFHLMTGQLSIQDLASDEIQIGALVFLSLSSALIGTFLVLKKMTMLANSLSHTILLGIVTSYLLFKSSGDGNLSLNMLIVAALVSGLLTSFLSQLFTTQLRLQEDASIGLVFTFLFALGITLVTLFTKSMHLGLEAIMGNIDAVHFHDLYYLIGVTVVNYVVFAVFFKEYTLIAFDSSLASLWGFRPSVFNYLLMFLLSLTSVAAFRVVGVLLVLSFFVGLPLTARLLCNRLKPLLFTASLIGIAVALVSVGFSRHFLSVYHFPLSTSALASVMISIMFILALIFSPHKGILLKLHTRRKLHKQRTS